MEPENLPPHHIVCDRCETSFPPIKFANNQATGCATSQSSHFLTGHYGSVRHDMTTYRIVRAEDVAAGNLCDGCVDVLVAAGALELTGEAESFDSFESALNAQDWANLEAEIDAVFAEILGKNKP